MVGIFSLIVGLGGLGSHPARAEVQNDAIGFSTNHVFESEDAGEHIDAMTGNMTLTIPIGPRYKLNDSFGYGLTLYYNSKIWEHECPNGPNACPGTLPDDSTYGLGFSLFPGRIYHHANDKSWVFRIQLEDGSEHFFCDTRSSAGFPGPAPDPIPFNYLPPNCDRQTTDTSHIYVEPYPSSNPTGWKATMPDGRKMYFLQVLSASTPGWLATKIESAELRSGNTAAEWVQYKYSAGSYGLYEIEDSHGRKTTISSNLSYPYDSNDIAIDVPAFANQESLNTATTARYVLRLNSLTLHDTTPGQSPISRNALTEIRFPAPANGLAESYRFDYGPDTTTAPRYGWVLQRTLPTGATVDYHYTSYKSSNFRPVHTELVSKTLTTGGAPYHWTWSRLTADVSFVGESYVSTNPYQVSVIDPFGNLTLYNFRYTLNNSGYDCDGHGACENNWSDGLLRDVSTYAGPEADTARLVRRVEYSWDSDIDAYSNPPGGHAMFQYRAPYNTNLKPTVHATAVNARQIEERRIIPGAGGTAGHTVKVTHSNWSYLCPQQTDEYVDDALYRSTFTSATGPGCLFPHYIEVKDALGNVVSRVDRTYDSTHLACEVIRKGTYHQDTMGACTDDWYGPHLVDGDVATFNTFDSTTWVTTSTVVKGGDESTTASRTTAMEYLLKTGTTERTGYLKTKQYGNFSWKAVDREVDFNTGLTSKTHDPAGNTTRYTWDGLGRLTKIEPTLPEKSTVITYTSLLETHVRQDLANDNYVETVYLYDDLGRLITTKRRNATGTLDVQKTEYDISGRVTRKSEWAPDGTAATDFKWTTYDYTIYTDPDAPPGTVATHADPLGRIHGVTTPDDLTPSTPTTETSYSGDVTTVTVRDVSGWANNSAANVTSSTVYTKDSLGRLVSVDSPGAGADAQYIYDETDNLTEVRLTDPATPAHVQVRRFDYDRLGRLRAASNPENGTVEYLSYDARGNLLKYKDARQNIFKMAYDDADRLLTRNQTVGSSDLLLAQNTYDTLVGFNLGASAGHLVQQDSSKIDNSASVLVSRVRFSYGAADSAVACPVVDGGYTGLNGRLSWQTSAIQPWGADLKTEYCQDALGMPTTISYPDINSSGRTRTQVTPTYQNGYLLELHDNGRGPQYLKDVSYAAGGAPKELIRVNSKDLIELDVRNRPMRFQSIGYTFVSPWDGGAYSISCEYANAHPTLHRALSLDTCEASGGGGGGWNETTIWDSGSYSYDMAGNVKTIGAEQYYYDALNRLVHGSIPNLGTTYTLDYQFDAFGNMSSQTRTASNNWGSSLSRSYPIEWQTNRLTQPVGASTIDYTYDENGNMTLDHSLGYVFDGQDRLREVMHPEKGRIGNYDYDASGYRVRSEADGVETYFLRDGSGQVLSEFQRPLGGSAAPVWNKDYIYALGKSFALVKNQVPAAPKKPRFVSLTFNSTTHLLTVSIDWPAVAEPDILGYNLERRWWRSSSYTSEVAPVNFSLSATTLSKTETLTDSTVYLIYTLRAMDTAGNLSDPSPQLVIYPNETSPPPAPTNVTGTPGDRSMTIRWNAVTLAHNDLAGYIVERQDPGGQFVRLNNDLLAAPEFLDTGLTNGITYKYVVKTVELVNRVSPPSSEACCATPCVTPPVTSCVPLDNVSPGKITDVFAEPDRPAHTVIVSWKRGVDLDVASYRVYRSTVAGTQGGQVGSASAVSDQESFSITDTAADQGSTYYYSVAAVDTSSNVSTTSDQIPVRPRHSGVAIPTLSSTAQFSVDNKGTTSTDGSTDVTGADVDGGDISSENDDVIKVTLTWTATNPAPSKYRIYRKASDEARYVLVGTQDYVAGTNTYNDTTVTKGDYTYYVTASQQIGGSTEESAANPPLGAVGAAADHAVSPFPAHIKVRNVIAYDGRTWFTSWNAASRHATVKWSRVTEPGLVGYNIYRICSFYSGCETIWDDNMEHFDCEPVWVRLNTMLLPPPQRYFEDGSTGGVQGCFRYAVRVVGPNGVEGDIGKIVDADLIDYDGISHDEPNDDLHHMAADSLANIPTEYPASQSYPPWNYTPAPSVLLGPINATARGSGGPAGAPPAPTAVTQVIKNKGLSGAMTTMFAQVSWTMSTPPSDLLGFYVETAGSPNGPWQRLTKHPVAWWERRYITQGLGMYRCNGYSGHTECVRYRVIAVDEAGNESQPVVASTDSTATCPATLNPPTNLRASTYSTSPCKTQLQWDPPSGATSSTEYYVYRLIVNSGYKYFYDTQRVVGQTSYVETGSDYRTQLPTGETCPDVECPYFDSQDHPLCGMGNVDAYYVTARIPTGGESPRSNLVFWQCGNPNGYARVLTDPDPTDAIASFAAELPGEALACWNTDGTSPEGSVDGVEERLGTVRPTVLATAPMLRLGEDAGPDPPWMVMDLHTDHLGSVRAVTTNAGFATSRHDYFPFGEEILSQASYNTHQYTGHERDSETKLDYMLARYYDATGSRFISSDSLDGATSDPQSWNRYTYVRNNPLRLVDPDGRDDADPLAGTAKDALIQSAATSAANYLVYRVAEQHLPIPGLDVLFKVVDGAVAFRDLATITHARNLQRTLYEGAEGENQDAENAIPMIDEIIQVFEHDHAKAARMLQQLDIQINKAIQAKKTERSDKKSGASKGKKRKDADNDPSCSACIPNGISSGEAFVDGGQIIRTGP